MIGVSASISTRFLAAGALPRRLNRGLGGERKRDHHVETPHFKVRRPEEALHARLRLRVVGEAPAAVVCGRVERRCDAGNVRGGKPMAGELVGQGLRIARELPPGG